MELFGVSYTVILVSLSALLGVVHFTCFVVVLAITGGRAREALAADAAFEFLAIAAAASMAVAAVLKNRWVLLGAAIANVTVGVLLFVLHIVVAARSYRGLLALAICMIFLQVPSHMVLGILSFRWFFAQHQW